MDQQSRTVTINNIKDKERDIDATQQQIATRKEMIEELVEQKQEWLDVETAKEELEHARQRLAQVLATDRDYNDQLEDLGQLKDKLKSEKELLSDLIVGYALETKERQIELNNQGDARELVIKGRLGKKAKYQTNMFAPLPEE